MTPTTPEQFARIQVAFDAVMERPPAEQSEALRRACDGDEAVRAEVARLLILHRQAGEFLETPLFAEPAPQPAVIGKRIGPYRVVSEIGQGGMSTVFAAERADGRYQQRVALKLLWPGAHGARLKPRFDRERQILADLDHPHIARLLDGGETDEGWPYLVMEHVAGVPLNRYCDEHQLDVRHRLQLFQATCGAVAYAHEQGILHRDLKPNNILVTAEGVVKLLDFGIAKLLKPNTEAEALMLTNTTQRPMTPAYASPEQVRGAELGPPSDVYSLGVILYELLTGVMPYGSKKYLPYEIERAICETDPDPPSQCVARMARTKSIFIPVPADKLRHELRGDLDTITLAALAKDPAQRYPSPAALSADIERHLSGQAIIARGGNPLYRLDKQ